MARFATLCAMHLPALPRDGAAAGAAQPEPVKDYWEKRLREVAPDRPDLIVLPEACDRFDGMSPEEVLTYYELRGESVLDFFREKAAELKCYIACSSVLRSKEEGADCSFRNSTVLIGRDGATVGRYDKNYPTIGEMERFGIVPGTEAPVFECDFGRVGCLICFDLNFEELLRRYAAQKPDLLLFSSRYHGGLKTAFWAYGCGAHLLGATGGAGRASFLVSPDGRVLAETTEYTHTLLRRVNLDCCPVHWDYNREKLEAMKRKYGSSAEIDDPGRLGSVLVRNSREDCTVSDLLAEFGIEPLEHYLRRAAQYRGDFLSRHG